ncbi:tetratricopeptide repeat protein 23 isoform X5 [Rattus norvegicus]|uniref:tetratricopeptide repeat protein 23 isoform X5 n=1 Tax=Rattus norvegicus TaxID=10116 RepID=UPI0019172C34|nr:tetratricopeptide repeat protein 23 isoform X5 [Rattus norvegicus]
MAVTKKRKAADDKRVAPKDNAYENMQESQETHMSSHLDEVIAAVSVTSKNRLSNKLLQTALFQPPREKLHLCEERAKSYSSIREAHLIILSKEPSPEDAADSALSIARAAVASGMHDHHDVAEKYFQESMTYLKDSEGTEKAKFLSIQDEFCSFLQTIGQKERAAMILRESLEAKIGVFGDFSPEVAETYRILGRADLAQGNNNGAHMKLKKGIRGQGEDTSITKECVQIETFLYGSQDKKTMATQQTIDTLSKISETPVKSKQSLKAKTAFCTSVPQYVTPGKARHSAAE